MNETALDVRETAAWKKLEQHRDEVIAETHLRDLLFDQDRCKTLRTKSDGIVLDFCRQRATKETLDLLVELAGEVDLKGKVDAMRRGERINKTEDREVLHHLLRWPRAREVKCEASGKKDSLPIVEAAVRDVHGVLDEIERFCRDIRSGVIRGATGKKIVDVVVIGIGGSYLGPDFVAEALRTEPECALSAQGRRLRFLANVDPVAVARTLDGLDPEQTLVVVISKTFTTAETILNAKTLRDWLRHGMPDQDIGRHFAAVTAESQKAIDFGVPADRIFPMWPWVGGRYSVTSAVGVLPLSLQYGFANIRQFLDGAHAMDSHFFTTDFRKNMPVLLGLFGVWNSSFLGYAARALLPYSEALLKFAAHVQQLDMESNGKRTRLADGGELGFSAGEIDFGEPGTKGQHSFYQLLHQGRPVPADFIGFQRSQYPIHVPGVPVANHDELMANFFAQPDALAIGKTLAEAVAEAEQKAVADGLDEAAKSRLIELAPHKVFPGNRPSNVLLFDALTPFTTGQLLALYEHRTAVQGFVWGIGSFDQWGVELGKTMATSIRDGIAASREKGRLHFSGLNPSTMALLKEYLGL